MHIPDGFIAPVTYLPLYGIAAGTWAYGIRQLKRRLNERTLPLLAVLTAFCFVLMLVAIPLPGGTTAHASGVALLALLFGPWLAYMAVSLVLLMQALLFGEGGVTALPVNALAMGLAGGLTAAGAFRLLRHWNRRIASFIAAWLSVAVAALLVALVLGIQPLIAQDATGHPLFFPFGLSVTLPAIVLPHLLVGIGEGLLTVTLFDFLQRHADGLAP